MNTTATGETRIGIIGGSGLGNALLASGVGDTGARKVRVETPFGAPSADVTLAQWNGVPIAFLPRHGEGHTIPPATVPYRANIWALKAVGCRWVMASGAVGSLREEIAPRDLVLVDQFIDRTTRRAGTFFDEAGGGAVHVELAEPVCGVLHGLLKEAVGAIAVEGSKVHGRGTYVCMEGPGFSTRAESLMHRQWGGDLIGMTAIPEARLAREAELSYAMIALATDYDCWKPHPVGGNESKQALLAEIIGHMHAATEHALALVKAAVPLIWENRGRDCPAHRALELAIWTDKKRIPEATRKRLDLLWGRYF
jgi:5'-methylthioadenosine phosphorylase